MKKTVAALLLVLALGLTGCGKKTEEASFADIDPKDYVTLGEYKGLPYDAIHVSISDYAVECAVRKLMASKGYETETFDEIKEGTVQIGDTANIDFAGRHLNGEAFEGGTAQGHELEIGSGSFIAGFEEGLVGVKIGDTVDLHLTFPKNYGTADLAGKEVIFTVTVNFVTARKTYKPLTDAIANELDETAKTPEQLYANNRKALEDAAFADAEEEAHSSLWSLAIQNASFAEKLPEALVEQSAEEFKAYYTTIARQSGYSALSEWLTANNLTEAYFNQKATEYGTSIVQATLTARAIAQAEGYEITDEIYKNKLAEYAKSSGYEAEKYEEEIGEETVKNQIFLDYASDFVWDNAIAK